MTLFGRVLGVLGVADRVAPLPLPGPASDIAGVIGQMRAMQLSLGDHDGVGHFNRMYLHVTERVAEAVTRHEFEDRAFLERLDIVFANLYFRALARSAEGHDGSKAWEPLIDCRANRRIAPIQFAIAGMNAHINYDLAFALVETCAEMGYEPRRDTAHRRDFLYVNRLLAQAKEEIEPTLKRGVLGIVDKLLGRSDEVAEIWSIERARDAAWVNAEALWKIKDDGALRERFTDILARTVGLGSRALLIPPSF